MKHFFPLLAVISVILFAYWGLPQTFFQQDEWQTFVSDIFFISKGITGIIESFLPTDPLSHFGPLARVFSWFEYIFYKINFTPYGWQSIFLHILNASLLYYFVFSWFKSKKIAFVAALFFAINSIPHQAVTWVVAANSYLVPTAFIILSLIFFQRRNILLAFGALFISLLFHENGIFLFFFYPIIILFNSNTERKKLLRTLSYGLILLILIYALIRIPFFFGLVTPIQEVTDISRPPITVYPYRAVSIGLKSFAGSLFPEKTLINISEEIVKLGYPQFITPDKIPNPFISQSIVFDLVSYALTIIVVCMVILFALFIRQNTIKKGLVWSLFFVPISLLPYGFVLGKAGYASILDPKFYYVGSIGVSILIALFIFSILQKFKTSRILKITVYFFFGLYLLSHINAIKIYIQNLEIISVQRRAFLTTIKSSYSTLPQKIVFFTQSNKAYYGMPDNEKILPVQVGFGKMLMIWYQKEEKFPRCFYENNFLLPLLSQGYKECDGRGFGYFRDYDKLVVTVRTNNIKPEEVVSFSWDGNKESFTDITKTIREKLSTGDR